jgi:hypothetical protein
MASWLRPSPVARYVLRSADLEIAAADITNPPKPLGWQEILENMIRESSVLIADPAKPGLVMLSQNGGQCNATFQVGAWPSKQPAVCGEGGDPRPQGLMARKGGL